MSFILLILIQSKHGFIRSIIVTAFISMSVGRIYAHKTEYNV